MVATAGVQVNDEFGAKLGFVLKFLTLSNGRVAAELAVDKSLVGRWVAGTVHPSAHNLGRLTEFLARRVPGLTLLDWDRSLEALRDRFGGSAPPPQVTPTAVADWLAHPKVAEVAAATAIDGMNVTGFWRTTRAAPDMPGRFCHDYVMIAPRSDGPLYCETGVFSSRLSGWGMIAGDQFYSCSSSHALGSMTFGIFNRVRAARIDAMDGISLACSAVGGGIPIALAMYMERVGELSGDAVADKQRLATLLADYPLARDGTVPDTLRHHLLRDIGPAAHSDGGDLFLMMRSMTSLARGASVDQPAVRLHAVS